MPRSEFAQCDPLAAYRQANFSMFRIHPTLETPPRCAETLPRSPSLPTQKGVPKDALFANYPLFDATTGDLEGESELEAYGARSLPRLRSAVQRAQRGIRRVR